MLNEDTEDFDSAPEESRQISPEITACIDIPANPHSPLTLKKNTSRVSPRARGAVLVRVLAATPD